VTWTAMSPRGMGVTLFLKRLQGGERPGRPPVHEKPRGGPPRQLRAVLFTRGVKKGLQGKNAVFCAVNSGPTEGVTFADGKVWRGKREPSWSKGAKIETAQRKSPMFLEE